MTPVNPYLAVGKKKMPLSLNQKPGDRHQAADVVNNANQQKKHPRQTNTTATSATTIMQPVVPASTTVNMVTPLTLVKAPKMVPTMTTATTTTTTSGGNNMSSIHAGTPFPRLKAFPNNTTPPKTRLLPIMPSNRHTSHQMDTLQTSKVTPAAITTTKPPKHPKKSFKLQLKEQIASLKHAKKLQEEQERKRQAQREQQQKEEEEERVQKEQAKQEHARNKEEEHVEWERQRLLAVEDERPLWIQAQLMMTAGGAVATVARGPHSSQHDMLNLDRVNGMTTTVTGENGDLQMTTTSRTMMNAVTPAKKPTGTTTTMLCCESTASCMPLQNQVTPVATTTSSSSPTSLPYHVTTMTTTTTNKDMNINSVKVPSNANVEMEDAPHNKNNDTPRTKEDERDSTKEEIEAPPVKDKVVVQKNEQMALDTSPETVPLFSNSSPSPLALARARNNASCTPFRPSQVVPMNLPPPTMAGYYGGVNPGMFYPILPQVGVPSTMMTMMRYANPHTMAMTAMPPYGHVYSNPAPVIGYPTVQPYEHPSPAGSVAPYYPTMPVTSSSNMARPAVAGPVPIKASTLHSDPFSSTSPYSQSHSLLQKEIIIYKTLGESFGVTFTFESQSVLIDPGHVSQWKGPSNVTPAGLAGADNLGASTDTALSSQETIETATEAMDASKSKRRHRRRRVHFGVLKVVSADKQNARSSIGDQVLLLQQDDIVLKVNGHHVGNLTFKEACGLFASCTTPVTPTGTNGMVGTTPMVQCPLVVARLKPRPVAASVPAVPRTLSTHTPKIPFVYNQASNQIMSGEFAREELIAIAQGVLGSLADSSRTLGCSPLVETERAFFQVPALSQRDYFAILSRRKHALRSIEQTMQDSAVDHWTSQWNKEIGVTDLKIPFLSDAQRSALRELPRPVKGCKCGSLSHEYVNDNKCVLYRNLRQWLPDRESSVSKNAPLKHNFQKLNAVGAAFKDRILKLKEVTECEEEEARFVNEMEEIQVRQLKMAIFAPSFSAMVLSSVAELDGEAKSDMGALQETSTTTATNEPAGLETLGEDEEEDDDEDDDLPLMALGKRSDSSAQPQPPEAKRPKLEDGKQSNDTTLASTGSFPLDVPFLAKILRHISLTWGHIYTEPSDSEYAWRWEVFHGQTGSGQQDATSKNPRKEGSRSFENVRFALSEQVMSRLSEAKKSITSSQAVDYSQTSANDVLLMSHLLSAQGTGVYDEVMALVKMGILRRTSSGYVALADDWSEHVEPLLLDDMERHWSKRADPANKHCVNESVRDELENLWTRVDRGWAFSSDPDDLVFADDEWDEWKGHFQGRHESQLNEVEGIEKFGI